MTQSDLTKADLARRPHVVHYTGTNTSGYIGFKTAEDADDFRHRAAEFGTCRLAAPVLALVAPGHELAQERSVALARLVRYPLAIRH